MGELNHRALLELARYETYHMNEAKPDIKEVVRDFKAQAWSASGTGKVNTSSLELVRSSRKLAGGVEEREGEEIPQEPEVLAQMETQTKSSTKRRKARGKKGTQPKKTKPQKGKPKKRKDQEKPIPAQGKDQGRRGSKRTRKNKESAPKQERPRSESSSFSREGRTRRRGT